MFAIGGTVRHKTSQLLWKIVAIGPDWVDCMRKQKKARLKKRFQQAEVQLYFATAAVGITRTIPR
ncbi:hypothetical protein [Paraburkholderia phenoliruptrix]|uniref:hypothetical protein n=1 Tax=Paraburkholderia phenoliruptrix TaxID=252970 RepID=UPI0028699361|nr:hypothetical protein [Paraburkholderia phenoliruptrix]WMY11111.1 hypothetical protein P3F88_31140 [Paraburkholderia phenoliruptrix]